MERRDFLKVAALTGAAIAVPGLEAAASSVAGSGAGSASAGAGSVSGSGAGSVSGSASAGAGVARYADKPVQKFRFRPDGKFKVLQFTDTHYIAGNPKSERALKNVIQMLDIEKPDLVIHTGDIVYGNPADAAA
ncbi:MAG: metallophosphoesterase, partial [Bacteroidales bacterium]|nr:metallophosphoesterase [Bacteroidales bacterium]